MNLFNVLNIVINKNDGSSSIAFTNHRSRIRQVRFIAPSFVSDENSQACDSPQLKRNGTIIRTMHPFVPIPCYTTLKISRPSPIVNHWKSTETCCRDILRLFDDRLEAGQHPWLQIDQCSRWNFAASSEPGWKYVENTRMDVHGPVRALWTPQPF